MKFSEWTGCRSLTDAKIAARLAKLGRAVSHHAVRSWRMGWRKPNAPNRLAIRKLTGGQVGLTEWDDKP